MSLTLGSLLKTEINPFVGCRRIRDNSLQQQTELPTPNGIKDLCLLQGFHFNETHCISLQTFNKAPQQDYLDHSTALAPSPGSSWAATAQQLQFPTVKQQSSKCSRRGDISTALGTNPVQLFNTSCSALRGNLLQLQRGIVTLLLLFTYMGCKSLTSLQLFSIKLKKQPWNKKKGCLMCLLNRR